MAKTTEGLTCPNCASVIPVPEGARIVECPSCDFRSLVQGERGIRRWQVRRQTERATAEKALQGFYRGMNKARDLRREARLKDLFLVYLPYWRVQAFVAGWMFGRVKSGKDKTRPVEVEVFKEMTWNDAAVDVAEFGVHRVVLRKEQLQPYDDGLLHSEAMVFEPAESRTEAEAEAHGNFTHQGQGQRSMQSRYFQKFHFLRQRFSLVYYPLWVARYEYKQRNYQVVMDGVEGKVLYGKAPGNIFYRAAALVAGMALGNLVLVNGCALAMLFVDSASSSSDDDGSFLAILVPVFIGIAIMVFGYRAFRYGEEVEKLESANQKAKTGNLNVNGEWGKTLKKVAGNNGEVSAVEMMKMGMQFLDEIQKK